jgi:hypothetical protein
MQSSKSFVHSSYSLQISLLARLLASSGKQVRSYPQAASSSPRLSNPIHPRVEQYASVGRDSETLVSPHHNQSIKKMNNLKISALIYFYFFPLILWYSFISPSLYPNCTHHCWLPRTYPFHKINKHRKHPVFDMTLHSEFQKSGL